MSPDPIPHDPSWRDQLIELDLPGVGPITACTDPELFADPPPIAVAVENEQEIAHRRREPTAPPAAETMRATLRDRRPLVLQHSWLVVPALGPVLPTLRPEGTVIADLSAMAAPAQGGSSPRRRGGPVRPPQHSWFRRPAVVGALRRRGGPVALGALVGTRRDWFEPAAAAREDLLAPHPDQALESVLTVAVDQGQSAVLRIGPAGLDVIPTGSDPRVPALAGLELLVTARPAQCPLQGSDGTDPCRPVGGPWIRRAHAAQVDWEARRSQALAVQACGVCFGEALPPEPDQPPVPRLSRRAPVPAIDRLHLRSGDVVRIDPIAPPGRDAPAGH
ncbi:hypothetical protein [Brachybacterium vulturis]|uniref:hypothetical protein n=1 Tax=Brachybacterium vulturis TaxID=2017484 RepID=UPI00373592A0